MESRWTDRTVLLLGEEKMRRLQEAHVLVVGQNPAFPAV